MKITLYSTGCPKCSVLKKKLDMAHIKYEICREINIMEQKGMKSAPALEVDGKILDFNAAIKWLKEV